MPTKKNKTENPSPTIDMIRVIFYVDTFCFVVLINVNNVKHKPPRLKVSKIDKSKMKIGVAFVCFYRSSQLLHLIFSTFTNWIEYLHISHYKPSKIILFCSSFVFCPKVAWIHFFIQETCTYSTLPEQLHGLIIFYKGV